MPNGRDYSSGSKEREAGHDNLGQPFSGMGSIGLQAHICREAAGATGTGSLKAGLDEEATRVLQGRVPEQAGDICIEKRLQILFRHCFRRNSSSSGDCWDYCQSKAVIHGANSHLALLKEVTSLQ